MANILAFLIIIVILFLYKGSERRYFIALGYGLISIIKVFTVSVFDYLTDTHSLLIKGTYTLFNNLITFSKNGDTTIPDGPLLIAKTAGSWYHNGNYFELGLLNQPLQGLYSFIIYIWWIFSIFVIYKSIIQLYSYKTKG